MTKQVPFTAFLLVLIAFLFCHRAVAQTNTVYTSDNTIFLTLDGVKQPFPFASNALLVNYNKATQKLECRLNVSTLLPVDPAPTPEMAYEVLYAAKYPELYMEIDLPANQINSTNLVNSEPVPRVIRITLQGATNETVVPVAFVRDKGTLVFSTSFDLMLENFQATIPVKYVPLLTGRVLFTIRGARYTNYDAR
ncbi:hypothetical protein [Pontibacter chitinilyticus]|uniref:hypothetical protein n=1 Tax=Pontibacter chitinilyticus TaxID=2674989 RepID=UPI00321B3086